MLIVDKNFKQLNYGYWCSACGDLHYHGRYGLGEYDLPHELRWIYNNLWGECYDFLCYLMDMNGQYGLAFVAEYDTCTAEDCGIEVEDLFTKAVLAASRIEMEIDMDKIVTIEPNGFDPDGWRVVVFIPSSILYTNYNEVFTVDKLQKLSEEIYEIVY